MKRTAKKRVAKSAKPKLTRSQVIFLLVVGVIILVGGYYFVVKPIQIRAEKNRFLSAKSELQKIANQLQQNVGNADDTKVKELCDRPNLKYAQGPLGCFVSIELRFDDITLEKANDILEVALPDNKYEELRSGNFATLDSNKFTQTIDRQVFYRSMNDINSLTCNSAYTFYGQEAKKSLVIELLCDDYAITEHFPLKN